MKNLVPRRLRKAVAASTVLALLLPLVVLTFAPPASAAYVTPKYVRSIGGMGRPGVFAWGAQWNPKSNEMLVGDYLHFKVRRYDLNGNHLGDFWNDGDCGQPYTVGVDARDGAIYVAELKDNPFRHCIAKYDQFGNFLYRISGTGSGGADDNTSILNVPRTSSAPRAFYPVWMTVEEDTGDVWILDSHYTNKDEADPPEMLRLHFDDATKSLTVLDEWPVYPPEIPLAADCTNPIGCAPRIYGVDIVTAPGNANDDMIYMTDAWNRRAYKYNKAGEWQDTFAEGQTGGDNRGVVVNEALDRVYIVDAEHSDIDVYRMDGSYVNSFANAGGEAGEFAGGGRQMDIDGAGNVWAADFGGFETEKYSPTGTPLLTAPTPARKPPVGLLGQPRDVAVDKDTGEVWVADAWNQRFQRFSATGASMGAWGQRGPGGPFDMNYPRSIAVQKRANGSKRVWVVNERGHHMQVYNYPTTATNAPTYVRQIGEIGQDNTDPGHFRWPVDVEFYTRPDGRQVAIIGDRMAASVKILDAETFEELLFIEDLAYGTAVDPATGLIYTMNGTKVEIYDQAGQKRGQFGTSGSSDGQFKDTTDAVFAGGLLYITDELSSRVQVFQPAPNTLDDPLVPGEADPVGELADDLSGTFVGKWGSTYGPNIYDFKGPVGIDADSQGRVYITDSGNDRIQVFDPAVGKPADAVSPAVPVVTVPASAQANLTALAPVTIQGTATDNVAVGNVEISIQDYTTNLWWNGSNQSWEATQTNSIAGYSGTTAASVNWRWVFLGVTAQGRYVMHVKTRDHNGNFSQPTVRTFAMPGATAPPPPPPPVLDTVRPNGLQAAPTANQVFPKAAVAFSGTATDNVGVSRVRIAVKRVSDGRWLSSLTSTSSSAFSTTFKWHETTLDVIGGTAVNWSWSWPTPPTAGGSFQTLVEAIDAAGNVDNSKPQIPFSTTTLPPDTVAPETTLTTPTEAQSFDIASGVSITGGATDDVGVAGVRVAITNTGGLFWTGSGWSANPATVEATLATPNTTASEWSYMFNPPVAGSYTVTAATARDSTNSDASPAGPVTFTVTGSVADTVNPDATITSPTNNQVLPRPTVTFTGNATDNVGVAEVKVAIRSGTTGAFRWWNGTAWVTSTTWLTGAALTASGSPTTGWSFSTWTPTVAGPYSVTVRAQDAAGNLDTVRPWVNFSVS